MNPPFLRFAFVFVFLAGFGLQLCFGTAVSAEGPPVSLEQVGVNLLVEWPVVAIADGFVLEGAESVGATEWDRVPGVATNFTVLKPGERTRFLRLSNASRDGAMLRGVLQSGGVLDGLPLPQKTVTLYEATSDVPIPLVQTVSDAEGRFEMRSPKVTSGSVFFVTASISAEVELVAILGPVLPSRVVVNELTTVAAAYSMAQFYRTGVIQGPASALRTASAMNDNVVDLTTGDPSGVLLASPNADESESLRMTRSLANLLASCTADPAEATKFLALTRVSGGGVPTSTPQAMANLARDPGKNVSALYDMTRTVTRFLPPLESAPDAWTVTVKINDSGDDSRLIAGMGFLVFDANGYGWVTDNVVQGTPYSARNLMVFQPNGFPAAGGNGGPRSPISSGGVLGGGYGITIDPLGSIWVGNFGWGPVTNCEYYPGPTCGGSVSKFAPDGTALSGPEGIQGGPNRAQGMVSDSSGNIWITSYADDSVYVFRNGNPKDVASVTLYSGSQPFAVQMAKDGTAWVSCGGGIGGKYVSSLVRLKMDGSQLIPLSLTTNIGSANKGISVDSLGIVWVASQGASLVYAVAPDGTILGGFGGGGVNAPWGATVDGEDNIWVANFGPLSVTPSYTSRLSKLAGANPATRPPGHNLGDPISPATGYTVRSAGQQVLLHDGTPLYGTNGPPAFEPLQRMTATSIDRAGNLWALNNWKNRYAIDVTENPGGDGIVIFVGLAPPPK